MSRLQHGGRAQVAAASVLFFFSGCTALVYQVLWLKELGLVFGSAAHAAATTLSVFFLGLAVGGWLWGRRSAELASPLRGYGLLELAVAASGALYFLLVPLYTALYTPLYAGFGEHLAAMVAAKFAMALLVLFPPAFFMGGTFPLLAEYVTRSGGGLARLGSRLYAVNIIGAACGAFAAAFWLPPLIGYRATYLAAVGGSAVIGLVAIGMARPEHLRAAGNETPVRSAAAPTGGTRRAGRRRPATPDTVADLTGSLGAPVVATVAFGSGFVTLGLEVIWTRMFAQVLQNSVYTFAIVLIVVLLALAGGGLAANLLGRLPNARPERVLLALLCAAGLCTGLVPFLFFDVTDGMSYLGATDSWGLYVASIFFDSALVLAIPGAVMGACFPYLLRVVDRPGIAAGSVVGNLSAINTGGAILGSLLAGFALLPSAGLWGAHRLLSAAYFGIALLIAWRLRWPRGTNDRGTSSELGRRPLQPGSWWPILLAAAGFVLFFTLIDATSLPTVRLNASRGERLLGTWEGSDGVVSVVERDGGLRIKVNNYYSLGGTASLEYEQNQTLIPLISHPRPHTVFYLGLGTGISAGASLRLPVERVVVCELVPEVITAAEAHFQPFAGGLFQDPRARVLPCDGRNHLLGSPARYDAIIADLFIPWRQGVGSVYSRDHYAVARERLAPGGVYVQWLPMYQLGEAEFFIIARTMLEVFPQVVVWRGDFFPAKPILALVGSEDGLLLDPAAIVANGAVLSGGRPLPGPAYKAVTLPFYVGNLGAARHLLPPGPINTDDRPVIEYLAPVTHRRERAGAARWFVGADLLTFFEWLAMTVPIDRDPYVADLSAADRSYVVAGMSYYKAAVLERLGRSAEAQRWLEDFERRLPVAFSPGTDDAEVYTEAGRD